jgi:acetyl-CoA acyltransferase 1
LAPGGGATEFRGAALVAGFTEATAVKSLNRQCSSGLQACVDIANAIKNGMIEIGVGAGVESMSTQYGYVYSSSQICFDTLLLTWLKQSQRCH